MKRTDEQVNKLAYRTSLEQNGSVHHEEYHSTANGFIMGYNQAVNDLESKWIKEKDRKPEFEKPVLVYCRIYGRFLAKYIRIDPDYNWGEWRDCNRDESMLPPVYWTELLEAPKED